MGLKDHKSFWWTKSRLYWRFRDDVLVPWSLRSFSGNFPSISLLDPPLTGRLQLQFPEFISISTPFFDCHSFWPVLWPGGRGNKLKLEDIYFPVMMNKQPTNNESRFTFFHVEEVNWKVVIEKDLSAAGLKFKTSCFRLGADGWISSRLLMSPW